MSTDKVRPSEVDSVFSDGHAAVEHRGLRQKLSLFRLRITGGAATETRKEAESAPSLDDKVQAANHGPEAGGEASGQIKRRATSTRSERMGESEEMGQRCQASCALVREEDIGSIMTAWLLLTPGFAEVWLGQQGGDLF